MTRRVLQAILRGLQAYWRACWEPMTEEERAEFQNW